VIDDLQPDTAYDVRIKKWYKLDDAPTVALFKQQIFYTRDGY